MGYDMYWLRKDPDEELEVEQLRGLWQRAVDARDALPRLEQGRINDAYWNSVTVVDLDDPALYIGRSPRYQAAQDQVRAASRQIDQANRSYFRLNGRGMRIVSDLMADLGMVFDDIPPPPWPKASDYGLTDREREVFTYPEEYEAELAAMPAEKAGQFADFDAAHNQVLTWHGKTDVPGIPAHKFSTNDGWIVLPAEARAALMLWQQQVDERGAECLLDRVRRRLDVADRAAELWTGWLEFLNGSVTHDGFEVR